MHEWKQKKNEKEKNLPVFSRLITNESEIKELCTFPKSCQGGGENLYLNFRHSNAEY